MNGRKFIFLTDLALMLAFVPTFWTGVEGHLLRHDHGLWHDRMVPHTVAGLLFTAAAIVHLWSHRGWYRGLAATGCGGRKRAVLLLSLVFLATVGSGVSLLAFVDGAGSPTGTFHYAAGAVLGFLSLFHLLRRMRIFRSGAAGLFVRRSGRSGRDERTSVGCPVRPPFGSLRRGGPASGV